MRKRLFRKVNEPKKFIEAWDSMTDIQDTIVNCSTQQSSPRMAGLLGRQVCLLAQRATCAPKWTGRGEACKSVSVTSTWITP